LDFFVGVADLSSTADRFGFGDIRLFAKYQAVGNYNQFSLSIIPEFYFPTGVSVDYFTNSSFAPGIKTALEYDFKYLHIVANLGLEYFYGATSQGLDNRIRFPAGLGGYVPINAKWGLNAEAQTTLFVIPGLGLRKGVDQFYIGAHYNITRGAGIAIGATAGNFQPDSSASFGMIAGVKYMPLVKDLPTQGDGSVCGERPLTARFFARTLNPNEMEKTKILPYISTPNHADPLKRHEIPTFQLGQMTGLADGGVPYIYASQVVFAVDIVGLPARSGIVGVDMLALKMNLKKVSRKNYLDTEILCFIDERVCSGELYRDKDWMDNMNQNFLGGKETPNDFFTRQYLDREVGVTPKGKIFASEVTLPLTKLLENSVYSDPLNLIYKDMDIKTPLEKKTLYIVVADDTYVSNDAYLDVVLRENTCLK
jgi:hypothetical protein